MLTCFKPQQVLQDKNSSRSDRFPTSAQIHSIGEAARTRAEILLFSFTPIQGSAVYLS